LSCDKVSLRLATRPALYLLRTLCAIRAHPGGVNNFIKTDGSVLLLPPKIKELVLPRTLAQLNAQITKLQQEADALQAKEVAGVVERIREAIEHYGLTPDDLFGQPPARSKGRAKTRSQAKSEAKPEESQADAPVPASRKSSRRAAPARKPAGAPARKNGVIRFRDEAGNSWTGHGKRPNWFKAAIEAGKTPEDLAVGNG
jgi:DNA-binding protein H-NS